MSGKFEEAFIQCLKDGVYPGPANINERYRKDGERVNRLNGQKTKERLALMYVFGVAYQRGHYIPPYEWTGIEYVGLSTKGEIPEYPYLTEDDGFATGMKKPEQGYRKHEIQDPSEPWKLRRK